MKRFASFTVLVLLTMLLLAGTAVADPANPRDVGVSRISDFTLWPTNSNLSGAVYDWAAVDPTTRIIWDDAPLIRNVPGQLIHTDFQVNTNSCASCHMTHTAVGRDLLIRSTTSATCFACHDGTMGFLNVNAPATGLTATAGMGGSVAAGTFGVDTNRTASRHDVFQGAAATTLSVAPGGNRTATGTADGGGWSSSFTCASCHAPHGSHSIRLLHVNPNNVAVRAIAPGTAGVAGGRWSPNARADGFTVASAEFDTVSQVWVYPTVHAAAYAAPWVAGSTGSAEIAGVGRVSAMWTRIYHSAWNPNTQGVANPTAPSPAWNATTLNNMLTRFFTINFATGRVTQTQEQRDRLITRLQAAPFNLDAEGAANAPLNIDVARGLQVRARVSEAVYDNASPGLPARLVAGARQLDFLDLASYDAPAYNLFCAACHTDYLPIPRAGDQTGSGVGIYSQKFRHTINRGASDAVSPMPVRGGTAFSGANLTGTTTGSNQLMCLSCHFAHGADASMMLFADNTRVSAGSTDAGTPTYRGQNDVGDTVGGCSVLKRYINQASCWHCHVRSSATPFLNTDYYWQMFPNGPTW